MQLFWALGITLIVYSLPAAEIDNLRLFTNVDVEVDVGGIAETVEGGAIDQFNVPFLDVATLVLYSGNLFFDLLANFATAVPQMIGLLLAGIFLFIPLDAVVQTQVKLFFWVTIAALYLLSIIGVMLNVRSGRVV